MSKDTLIFAIFSLFDKIKTKKTIQMKKKSIAFRAVK